MLSLAVSPLLSTQSPSTVRTVSTSQVAQSLEHCVATATCSVEQTGGGGGEGGGTELDGGGGGGGVLQVC